MIRKDISLQVNGRPVSAQVEPRQSLADFLRDGLDLTATHLGCEHGVCGACTVLLDGEPVRGCITLAVAAEGRRVDTLEAFADDPLMATLRRAFAEHHGLQCGFCTPGMLLAAHDIIRADRAGDDAALRAALSGNICRCTGYAGILRAISAARDAWRAAAAERP
jgi:carbon-monoxide dehydrogenase small subunit